jgi:hypothetical protein
MSMPRDYYQRARAKDHQRAAARQYAEFGRFTTYESAFDDIQPPADSDYGDVARRDGGRTGNSRIPTCVFVDWLNDLRRKAGNLAERFPPFQSRPRRGDKTAVLLLSHGLSGTSEEDRKMVHQLVECIGEPAIEELRRLQKSRDERIRQNANLELTRIGETSGPLPNGARKIASSPQNSDRHKSSKIPSPPPNRDLDVRQHASELKPQLVNQQTITYFRRLLLADDAGKRVEAIRQTQSFVRAAMEILVLLRRLRSDPNIEVRNTAASAVASIESANRQTKAETHHAAQQKRKHRPR